MIATSGFALAYFGFNIGRSHSNQEDQATTQATITAWQNKYAEVTREKPFLSDPLNQNINKWDNGSSTNRSCLFTNGTYHVSSLTPYALGLCASNAASDFNNIGYQVDMTILHGDEGGLVFRLTTPSPTQILTYIFSVNRKGTYNLWVANGHYSTLLYRSSSAIKTGLNQSNLLCIIAQGKHIALYINKHYVASVIDTSATTGAIGLFARSLSDTTDVAFSNLKLWRL